VGVKIKVKYLKDEIAALDIGGGIDINSSALIETVGKLVKKGINKFIINLNDVDFIDYNGLSVLAIAYKSVLNSKGIVKLVHVPNHVMELLRIVRLDNVFDIYKNVDDALESFDGKKQAKKQQEPHDEHPLRRRFTRLDMDINVYYKKSDASPTEASLHSGLAGNISGAGLFLRTINMLPAGTKVDLDIVIPEQKKCISMKGIVMWLADKQLQPQFYPGMGVCFLDDNRKAQEELISFIEKNIAK